MATEPEGFWKLVDIKLSHLPHRCAVIAKRKTTVIEDYGGLMEVQQFKKNKPGLRDLDKWRKHYMDRGTPFVVTVLGSNISLWKERLAGGCQHWYRKHIEARKGEEGWRTKRYRPTG